MKKLISLISTFSLLASLSFSVSAAYTEPTIYLEASTTGYSAGDVVTVTCKYDGFSVTPYDDAETGAGQVVTGTQTRIAIPGGIGAASANKQFVRAGATSAHSFTSGSAALNYDITNGYFSCVVGGISDPMSPSGTLWTITMKLQNDITSDLVFDFVEGYEQNITYDNYEDWTMGDTVMVSNATLVPYTLEAPASDIPVESVTLDKTELTLDLNGSTTDTLTATVAPENASDKTVTWESSDPEVVAVDGGNLTAKKVGTATITAKAGEKSATCEVTVKDTTPPADPKGTVIQGADVIYAGSAAAATITAATKFQIEYTGSDESIKQPNGTKVKNISRTAEDILGGVIGEGSLTGTVHFGIKVPASVVGTDEAKHFQINVIND